MHCRGGLFEPLTAIGVWATRPHLSCVAAKEGESPSLLYSLPFFGSVPLSVVTAVHTAHGYEKRFHTDGENRTSTA
jgi:hypothetical protein